MKAGIDLFILCHFLLLAGVLVCHLIFSFSYVGGMDSIKKVIMDANKRRKIPSYFVSVFFFFDGKDGSPQLILFNEEKKSFFYLNFHNKNKLHFSTPSLQHPSKAGLRWCKQCGRIG